MLNFTKGIGECIENLKKLYFGKLHFQKMLKIFSLPEILKKNT